MASTPPTLQPTAPAPPHPTPRLIIYSQTRRTSDDRAVSLLPLLDTGATHVIIAAFHLNDDPDAITLNDDHPRHQMYDVLWEEVRELREKGIKVLGMLGGAAKGSFERLTGDEKFVKYYTPLLSLLRTLPLDGLDLDIEEEVPLSTPIRLLRRLRSDMGPSYILTMAPVATALLPPAFCMPHLSGFSYFDLEATKDAGELVSWYNTQLYCGWGSAENTVWYEMILSAGWDPAKVVLGVVTSSKNGSGFVDLETFAGVLRTLQARYPRFGGVMGWEYFNGEPGGEDRPWEWACAVAAVLKEPTVMKNGGEALGDVDGMQRLPPPQLPFRAEDMDSLLVLGFQRMQAFAALNATDGDVNAAANLLLLECAD